MTVIGQVRLASGLALPYGRRTGDVRALWVVARPSALHTHHMPGTTTVFTYVMEAVAFAGAVWGRVFPHARASRTGTTPERRRVRRFAPTLLLALPLLVTVVPEAIDSTRTIEVTVSRDSFSPERIEVHLGERVRLNVVSVDGTRGFRIKALGLNAVIPAGGRTVTVDLSPQEVGTFEITCSEHRGRGHGRIEASLIVTPGT